MKTALNFPTQALIGKIGILCQGEYCLAESISVGEGGLYFHSPKRVFQDGQRVVVTFSIPHFLETKHEFFSQQGQIVFVDIDPRTTGFQRLGATPVKKAKRPLILFAETTLEFKKKVRHYLVSTEHHE